MPSATGLFTVCITTAGGDDDAEVTYEPTETVRDFLFRLVADLKMSEEVNCFPRQLTVRRKESSLALSFDSPPVDLMAVDHSRPLSDFVEDCGTLVLTPYGSMREVMFAFARFSQSSVHSQTRTSGFGLSAYTSDNTQRTAANRQRILDAVPAPIAASAVFANFLTALAEPNGDDGTAHFLFTDLCALLHTAELTRLTQLREAEAAQAAAAAAAAVGADGAGAAPAVPPADPIIAKIPLAVAPADVQPGQVLGVAMAGRDALCCAIVSLRYGVVERILRVIAGTWEGEPLARSGAPRLDFAFAPLPESNSSNIASPAGALLTPQERDSLFYLACERGHVNMVKWFIANDWSLVTARNANGMTPLHVCAERGHTAIAGMLLGTAPALSPADEDASSSSAVVCKSEMLSLVDDLGRSPVLIAAERGHMGLTALFSRALRA